MSIPDEAVQAAARALFERTNSGAPWDAEDKHWWNAYVDSMCTALEAAAPHMAEAAWDEGSSEGYKQRALEADTIGRYAGETVMPNPYRTTK